MDIVLEVFDTFIFDRLYSAVLPVSKSQFWERVVDSTIKNASSAFSTIEEVSTGKQTWTYEPATKYITLEPSHYAYSSAWTRDNTYRQALSLFLITWLFGLVVYFLFSTLSYVFVFDKATFKHPRFLKNQIRMEIRQAAEALPGMALLTVPAFLAEVNGYGKLYDSPSEAPFYLYNFLQFPFFILFTDFFIYWIHRGLHNPLVYKRLHKPHHKWIVPTPYASHAFHPLDGFAQSVPYHVFPFLFPLSKFGYILLFAFVNIWTIFIHDGEYIANNPIINGAACHNLHHSLFRVNFGQYTTLWDRLGGSYRKPNPELFDRELKMAEKEWQKQAKESDRIAEQEEGSDDRVYIESTTETKKTM